MDLGILAKQIKGGEWDDLMPSALRGPVASLSQTEIFAFLESSCGTLGGPVKKNGWFDVYWSASWVTALRFADAQPASTVLEIGVGVSTNFVRAASNALGPRGKYIAVNINTGLTESARSRTRTLPIQQRFIHADAAHIRDHLDPESCVFVALNHEINDMVQTIVFETSGRKTDHGDWYEMVPEMVALIRQAQESGELERSVRPRFVETIRSCSKVLKTGGVMGFNNALVPSLLEAGYSKELLGSYIPLARTWLCDSVESLKELRIPGFDTRWWLFFRRV